MVCSGRSDWCCCWSAGVLFYLYSLLGLLLWSKPPPVCSRVVLYLCTDRDRGSDGRRQVVADPGAVPHHRAGRRLHQHRRRQRVQAGSARPALQAHHHTPGGRCQSTLTLGHHPTRKSVENYVKKNQGNVRKSLTERREP